MSEKAYNSEEEFMEWDTLWIASKRMDSRKIRHQLIGENPRGRNKSSLLPHTDESLALYRYVFGIHVSEHNAVDLGRIYSVYSIFDKKVLGLRALLLLPPHSLVPWNAINSYIRLPQKGTVAVAENNENDKFPTCGLLQRKSLGDVRTFISSICKSSGENYNDVRTIRAQRNELLSVCNGIQDQIYTTTENMKSSPQSEELVFQLIVPLFKAVLRADKCLLKKKRINNNNTTATISVPLATLFLDSVFRSNFEQYRSESVLLRKVPSLVSVAIDLRQHMSLGNWINLQNLILHYVRLQPTREIPEIIDSIISLIAMDTVDEPIFIRWVHIVLVIYHSESLCGQSLHDIDMCLCSSLSNLTDESMGKFLEVVAERIQLPTISSTSTAQPSEIIVPDWKRVNMMLLAFGSKLGSPTLHNYGAQITGYTENIEKADLLIDSILSLILHSRNDSTDQNDTRKVNVSTYNTAFDALWQTILRNEKIHDSKYDLSFSKLSQLGSVFGECAHLVRSTIKNKPRKDHKSNRLFSLDVISLWRQFAHQTIESKQMIDSIDAIVLAAAILTTLHLEYPSLRRTIVQEILDRICAQDRNQIGVNVGLIYCWILHTIVSYACDSQCISNDVNLEGSTSTLFTSIFQLVQRGDKFLPQNIMYELIRSLAIIPFGRREITTYFLQEIEQCSLVDCDSRRLRNGLDGIILILQRDTNSKFNHDESFFVALIFISTEIGNEKSIMTEIGRFVLLTKLLKACEEGQFNSTVVDRILNVALVRILPHFRFKDNTRNELLFMPGYPLCQDPGRGTTIQEEVLLLVRLILTPISNNSEPRPPKEFDWNFFHLVSGIVNKTNSSSQRNATIFELNDKSAKMMTISVFKSLIKHFLDSDTDRTNDVAGRNYSCDEFIKKICRQEVDYWAEVDHNFEFGSTSFIQPPQWATCALNTTIVQARGGGGECDQPICVALTSILLTTTVSLSLQKNSKTRSVQSRYEMDRSLPLSFVVNAILNAIRTIRAGESVQSIGLFMTVDDEYTILPAFFALTSSVFGRRTKISTPNKMQEYFKLLLPATLEVCTRLDSLLASEETRICSIIDIIYKNIVYFYCTVCFQNHESDEQPNDFIPEIKKLTLRCLRGVMSSSPFVKVSSTTSELESDIAKSHLELLQQLSKDLLLNSQKSAAETSALNWLYAKCIDKLIYALAQLLKSLANRIHDSGAKSALDDWECTFHSSSRLLWESLKCRTSTSQDRKYFKTMISIIAYKMPELLRLLLQVNYHSPSALSDEKILSIEEPQYSPIESDIFKLYMADISIEMSKDNKVKSRDSIWFSRIETKLKDWTLMLCLDNFECIWIESNRKISSNNAPPSGSIIKNLHSDLGSSISLGMALLEESGDHLSTHVMQKVCGWIDKVLLTLSNSATCVTRKFEIIENNEDLNYISLIDSSFIESLACLMIWLGSSSSNGILSPTGSNFVSVSKSWCKARNEEGVAKQISKIIDRIEELEIKTIKLSNQLKTIENKNHSRGLKGFIKPLLPQNESVERFIKLIDNYSPEVQRVVTNPSNNRTKIVPARISSLKTRKKVEAKEPSRSPAISKSSRKKRYRNSVVNDWIDLDQEVDGKRDNNVYDDLEDFILPG